MQMGRLPRRLPTSSHEFPSGSSLHCVESQIPMARACFWQGCTAAAPAAGAASAAAVAAAAAAAATKQ